MSAQTLVSRGVAGWLLGLLMRAACAANGSEDGQPFEFDVPPGGHAVGFKVIEQYDYSRTFRGATDALGSSYQGERARPIQTLVWYPAERSRDSAMTVADYVNLLATETSFGHPRVPLLADELRSAMRRTLSKSMRAVRGAPISSGRFPVVIYAPGGGGYAWENADWCEYVASFGYVVIASPSLGAHSRDMPMDLEGNRLESASAQALDISFLIGHARSWTDADLSAVAVAGFSWGGIANLLAAAKDSRIDALIGLDGSMRYYPSTVQQADVHPERITLPLLYFSARNLPVEVLPDSVMDKTGPNVLNQWTHGDLITAHVLSLGHSMFRSMTQRNDDMWWEYSHYEPLSLTDDYGPSDAAVGYAWVARYSVKFLDAYLKHDSAAMAFLKRTPIENGAPSHVLGVEFRAAVGTPASLEAVQAEAGRRGFAQLSDIYASFKKNSSGFELARADLTAWADDLIAGDHLAEAVEVLRFATQTYPESGEAYISLGDLYRRMGQSRLAKEVYEKSTEKDRSSATKVIAARKLQLVKETENRTTDPRSP